MNKRAFSLIELVFIIVIIAIISSVAIPKLMNINSKANISVIKQDISSIISSSQSYYLVNKKIDAFSDALQLNSKIWNITNTKLIYKENNKDCVTIELSTNSIDLSISPSVGDICDQLSKEGIVTHSYSLN